MVRILGAAAAAVALLASGACADKAPASSANPNNARITPLYPGPYPPVPTDAHPAFQWPPSYGPQPADPCKKVQHSFPRGTNSNKKRADEAKDFFVRVYDQYAKYCFGQDELFVLNNSCTNDLFGWGATIVDGIDTAIIMNLTSIVERQLAFIAQVDFTRPKGDVVVAGFDATIRYLGGLLSAYDLLTTGYVPKGTYKQSHIDALLKQAHTLGNKLKPEFNTKSGLPSPGVNFTTNQPVASSFMDPLNNKTYPRSANTAQAGTLILEFTRLSDLTGDQSFAQLAARAESYLVNPHPPAFYPGLVGSTLDTDTGNFLIFDYGWKAGIDSFIEYCIKMYYYNPRSPTFNALKDFWVKTVDSSIKHIALHPFHFPQLTFLSQADAAGNLEYAQDDYACFAGGNLQLGGAFLSVPEYSRLGLAVSDSCHQTYNTTVTGLGPAAWAWYNSSNLAYDPSADNNATERAMARKIGYYYQDPEYATFPESIESFFYSYRITGDERWLEYNYQILKNLERSHGPNFPYSGVNDVNQPKSFQNDLPAFFFAEVMKYIYLTFTDPDVISLDKWVFNTEGHPLRRNTPYCH